MASFGDQVQNTLSLYGASPSIEMKAEAFFILGIFMTMFGILVSILGIIGDTKIKVKDV